MSITQRLSQVRRGWVGGNEDNSESQSGQERLVRGVVGLGGFIRFVQVVVGGRELEWWRVVEMNGRGWVGQIIGDVVCCSVGSGLVRL